VELLNLLRRSEMSTLAADLDAVTRVLSARESRTAQYEAQLQATLVDALRNVKAEQDLRRAALMKVEEDSARLRRVLEEEAHSILRAAVSRIHEAGKKKEDEVSVHLDAVVGKIHALRKSQEEDLSASVAMIVEETEAKLKALFSKIHAPLKRTERDAVPCQKTHDGTSLAQASTSIPAAQQSKQQARAFKRKAEEVEHGSVSTVAITGEQQGSPPPGYSATPRFSGSVSLKKTREEREQRNPPTPSKETTQDLGGASVSLITVPVKEVKRLGKAK
jgi:hypothetical protein